MSDEGWQDQAKCRELDPELFFPLTSVDFDHALAALEYGCMRCPVLEPCWDYAQSPQGPAHRPFVIGGRFRAKLRDWTCDEVRAHIFRKPGRAS